MILGLISLQRLGKMRRLMTEEEVLELVKKINSEFGSDFNPAEFKFFIKDEKKGRKIFLYSGNEIPKIPVEWIGLHFGTIQDNKFISSIEGAQIIGKTATKKVLEIGKEDVVNIMSGIDLDLKEEKPTDYYILKSGKDILGVGRLEGIKIINLIPKSRRTSRQYHL